MRFKHLIVCVLYLFFNTAYAKNINPATVEDIVEARIAILTTVAQDIRNAVPTVAVGDYYQGGIVIYIDNTKQHGLILGLTDAQDTASNYSSHTKDFTYANGIGAGLINSAADLGHLDGDKDKSANTRLADWNITADNNCTPPTAGSTVPKPDGKSCWSAWYVPSIFEWQLVQNNFDIIQAALAANGGSALTTVASPDSDSFAYWSSTMECFPTRDDNTCGPDGDNSKAYLITFETGSSQAYINTRNINGSTNKGYIRGMRQF